MWNQIRCDPHQTHAYHGQIQRQRERERDTHTHTHNTHTPPPPPTHTPKEQTKRRKGSLTKCRSPFGGGPMSNKPPHVAAVL